MIRYFPTWEVVVERIATAVLEASVQIILLIVAQYLGLL